LIYWQHLRNKPSTPAISSFSSCSTGRLDCRGCWTPRKHRKTYLASRSNLCPINSSPKFHSLVAIFLSMACSAGVATWQSSRKAPVEPIKRQRRQWHAGSYEHTSQTWIEGSNQECCCTLTWRLVKHVRVAKSFRHMTLKFGFDNYSAAESTFEECKIR
jgi:hypothetical protein